MSSLDPSCRSVPTTEDLVAVIQDGFGDRPGPPRRVISLERRPSEYRTSFPLEELDVHLDDGSTLPLIFKDLAWQRLDERVQRAKPRFLYDARREIGVYRAILPGAELETAECYGSVVESRLDRYWLLLERLPAIELYQFGDLAIWAEVARWLARFHARFADLDERLAEAVPLLRHDREFYGLWMQRARAFTVAREPAVRASVEALARPYGDVVEALLGLPSTLIHGEFYASNVLVGRAPDDPRICPIDWEMAARGPGLIDLAALIAGSWTETERAFLARAYYDALPPLAGWQPTWDAFMLALSCCRLQIAVQWLGWSPDWNPPSEHAHDWLAEALSIARELAIRIC